MTDRTHQTMSRRRPRRSTGRWMARAAALVTTSLLALPLWADYTGTPDYTGDYYEESDNSYSFARVLEGSATLLTADGEREEVEIHQPVLVGDRLWVPHNARLELVLADRSLLRIEGDSELTFESIAYSADTGDRNTLIRLHKGNAQLVVPRDALGDSLPRLETPGASVYVHREGTFRVSVGRKGWTEVVVREGLAEMVTDRGSRLVHVGESGWGGDRGGIEISRARYRDGLERWGDDLSYRAARIDTSYVDESLRYVAAPLANHGGWVQVGSRHAWRPHKRHSSWRPYNRGYWRHTPIGATWVSRDPWGWVTHHYGSWDYDNGYGWVWYPGRRYAPARVHWYWGPSYVGWCPTGYYSNYYRRHRSGFGLNVGIYGWAGGSWGHFSNWNFTANIHFGNRRQHDHHYSGADLGRRGHRLDVGVVTTHPGRHYRRGRSANEIYASLRTEAGRHRQAHGRDLPDVTDFVGRAPLRDRVATRVLRPSDANKPLAIANGQPNGRRDGALGNSARTRQRDDGNAVRGRRDAGGLTRGTAEKPARRAESTTATGRRTRDGGKPAVTTPNDRGRRAAAPSTDRRGTRTSEGTRGDRRPYAPVPPRTTSRRSDRVTDSTTTPRRGVRPGAAATDQAGRRDARVGETRTDRPRTSVRRDAAQSQRRDVQQRDDRRRADTERIDAERRRQADRQRTNAARQVPRTTRPSTAPRSSRPRSAAPQASRPRSNPPRVAPTRPDRSRGTAPRGNDRGSRPRAVAPRAQRSPQPRAVAPRAQRSPQPRAVAPRAQRSPQPRATTPQRPQRPQGRSVQPNRGNGNSRGTAQRGNVNQGRRGQQGQVQQRGRQGNQRPQANGNNGQRGRRDGNKARRGDNNRRRDNN